MIERINGDLLNCSANVICHACNTLNVFGAGLAKQIKSKYPEAYAVDCDAYKKEINRLGNISFAETLDNKVIVNIYGQESIGRDSRKINYEALAQGFEKVKSFCDERFNNHHLVLGFPYLLGCGLAGGSFKIVNAMIEHYFENARYEVLVVRFDV